MARFFEALAPGSALLVAFWAAVMQERADPEIHLIPAGYTGEVTIVFHALDGAPLDIEDGGHPRSDAR